MIEYYQLPLLFAIGTVAGLLNVMAGGGSALTLPALIFLGLDSALANGTNRVAIVVQNLSAILSFRQEKMYQFRTSMKMALWTLPGGVLGAILAIRISDEWFQRILAVVLIGVVISMMLPGFNRAPADAGDSQQRSWLIYPAMFGIGFYGGFIQVGVGFLLMAALFHLLRLNLVHVNMHKVFIVLIYTIPALGVFIWSGNVDWLLGISLAAGNSFGGWWAAKLSVRKGDKIIRYVLFVAIILMALKLLDIF
ncbi:MAG: sulfite exporter TauE/SafE family protein [Calditrichaeota bacterium]|nr:sulfite exporter TauE/SafE family protein [Calditrichota bacterium]MCB0306138.1 sulfite exporter TauE/SafE family protein [Calditrichota bacterium]MCB9087999.1 sulfite exporter TauE/SafE family protein [Calditrichia bacterium]